MKHLLFITEFLIIFNSWDNINYLKIYIVKYSNFTYSKISTWWIYSKMLHISLVPREKERLNIWSNKICKIEFAFNV